MGAFLSGTAPPLFAGFQLAKAGPTAMFLIIYIRRTLGFGKVPVRAAEGGVHYDVGAAAHIRALILIYNGHIVLPRRLTQFELFLAHYNNLGAHKGVPNILFKNYTL
jgi:hypothetical protein